MRIVLLSGGVGGARMASGFDALDGVELTVVVNVGDDDEIHGLHVSPDLDTVVYTLAGVQGEQGWGRAGETWHVMAELERFPIDTSFRLGDRDLATNLFRTHRLREGAPLSRVTGELAAVFGLEAKVLPATDDPLRTRLRAAGTGEWMDFQTYFVTRKHSERVDRVEFAGADTASAAPGVLDALAEADAVVVAPSNPVLSVHPILAIREVREAVASARRVMAVSPLIGGAALKGPAADVLSALGYPPGNQGVLAAYEGLVTDLVVHAPDAEGAPESVKVWSTDIRIPTRLESSRLALEIVAWLS